MKRRVKVYAEDVDFNQEMILEDGEEIIGVSDVKEYGNTEQFYVTVFTVRYLD